MAMKKIIKTKRQHIKEENEIRKLIIIIFSILMFFGVMYLITYALLNKGVFSKDYVRSFKTEGVIDYETSTIGTIFDKADKEYYVIFDYFDDLQKKNVYLKTLLDIYSDKSKTLPIYKVDMSKLTKTKYLSEKENVNASKSSDLRINGTTLIKIKNGKNVLYLSDIDKISKELDIETK